MKLVGCLATLRVLPSVRLYYRTLLFNNTHHWTASEVGEITLTTEFEDSVNVYPVLSPDTGPGYTDVIPVSGLYQVYLLTSSASHVYIRVSLRQYQPEQICFRLACVTINLNRYVSVSLRQYQPEQWTDWFQIACVTINRLQSIALCDTSSVLLWQRKFEKSSGQLDNWYLSTVKPRFTAPRFTANPDITPRLFHFPQIGLNIHNVNQTKPRFTAADPDLPRIFPCPQTPR